MGPSVSGNETILNAFSGELCALFAEKTALTGRLAKLWAQLQHELSEFLTPQGDIKPGALVQSVQSAQAGRAHVSNDGNDEDAKGEEDEQGGDTDGDLLYKGLRMERCVATGIPTHRARY